MSRPTFKSRFEEQFALLLDRLGIEYGYEKESISYIIESIYRVDFKIGDIYVETKGFFDSIDRRKHLAIKRQHPELDIRFIFLRDNRLSKSSKTKYSDWCEKHGFKYHVGLGIPEKWLFDAFRGKDERPKRTRKNKSKKD